MRKFLWAALMLMAQTACQHSAKQTADMTGLPRVATPDTYCEDFPT